VGVQPARNLFFLQTAGGIRMTPFCHSYEARRRGTDFS
jgi:hypothetical protein